MTGPRLSLPTRGVIRRLADVRPSGGSKVLSIYVDLDPTRFATAPARSSEIRSLVGEAEDVIKNGELTHQEKVSLQRDVERAREYLEQSPDMKGAGALAIFCCDGSELFEVLRLSEPMEQCLVVNDGPFLEPLAPYLVEDDWCVTLVNRRVGRIFRGTKDELRDVEEFEDYLHRKHDQGGWSQARFQRGIEKEVQDHLAHTAERLFALHERGPFEHLLIGTTQELLPEVVEQLHPYVRQRVRGRIDVDVEHTTREQVLDAARPAMEEEERRQERALLDRLNEHLAKSARAAGGREDVAKALEEHRVDTLLLDEGATGTDEMILLALKQAADVRVLRHYAELERHDGVAALLRY